MTATDTIVALSTPPGHSGIGVIRLSGPDALAIVRHLLSDVAFTPEPGRVVLKNLSDPITSELLDRALVTYFKSPHSFTGEDVVELSCHGSPILLRHLLDVILKLDARAASAGEFTLRAVSHGKLNLSQAEAIRDLINAQTDAAAQQAVRQMKGELSARLQPIKDALLDIIVPLESSLEFVEDDLPEFAAEQIVSQLSDLVCKLEQLSATFRSGRLLRDGLKITLAGCPNVGKSSLFNALLLADRAIVTDIPGTTRDSLSETISFQGIPVVLTDTAGVRSSEDEIETLGVQRTRRAIADADLVIVVLDRSRAFSSEDSDVLAEVANSKHLIAFNKSDLDDAFDGLPEAISSSAAMVYVSAKTGFGLDALQTAILQAFAAGDADNAGLLITDARHFDLLQRAQMALLHSNDLLKQHYSEELVLVGLHNALRFLGEITGETTPDDVLSRIFATFCIGK